MMLHVEFVAARTLSLPSIFDPGDSRPIEIHGTLGQRTFVSNPLVI